VTMGMERRQAFLGLSHSGGSRCVHDHSDTDQADQHPRDVVAVGAEAVDGHAPQQRTGDEDTTVRSQDAPEVRIMLERRDEAIPTESQHTEARQQPSPVLSDALPNQPCAADLGQGGDKEEDHRSEHGHGGRGYKGVLTSLEP
jgi:hypothetical protein